MSSDNSFFVELQSEFLTESAFLLETYEESMLGLESGANPKDDLTQIFRVAHSIKGGAAAVGFADLSKFAHVMEDLLDLLRTSPEKVNSQIISLLLKSGDELKQRIISLQKNENLVWDTSDLVKQLVETTEGLSGKTSKHAVSGQIDEVVKLSPDVESEVKMQVPDDFFEHVEEAAAQMSVQVGEAVEEDHVNHELLQELLGQLAPEDAAAYQAQEEAEKAAKFAPTEVASVQPSIDPREVPVANVIALDTKREIKNDPVPEQKTVASKNGSPVKSATSSIKVDTARVDSVLDAVGELVVLKNQLVHDETVRNSGNPRLEAIVDQMDKTVRELYEKTLSIRMTPLKSLFVKVQRIVRDVSLSLDKPVDLRLIGEETEVERTVFELLNDPLVHLVRNALDHGVEKKEIRIEKGKPPIAKVTVSARQTGGNVTIDIIDDGGGINRERVLTKAIERGLVPSHIDPASIPDEQVFQFIFHAGFSTAEKVSDLSGRGVGLDVVKSNLDKINGKINIQSKMGVGSTFRLTIPLSTAITDGIIVAMDGSRYILPIYAIREIVRALPSDYTEISGAGKVANIRGVLIPVIDVEATLGKINWEHHKRDTTLGQKRNDSLSVRREESMLVIIESMAGQMALPVEEVIGQAQVVVKPIMTGENIPEIAGAAILGDGKTVLILDPSALLASYTQGLAS